MAQHYEAGAPRGRRMQLVDGWQDHGQGLQSGGKSRLGGVLRGRPGYQRFWGLRGGLRRPQERGGGSGDEDSRVGMRSWVRSGCLGTLEAWDYFLGVESGSNGQPWRGYRGWLQSYPSGLCRSRVPNRRWGRCRASSSPGPLQPLLWAPPHPCPSHLSHYLELLLFFLGNTEKN